ncbi:hypothetical protein HF874_20250 [Parabacteroides distasonis]|jgi:hypothetical protein|uniref:hypothetical protein n=1 Tax=Parabacteroides distasonis TaxID=823 RepID=UPI001474F3F7|nr:hypothetical protein [Parabacteroides distasonis]NME15086.1 hypothetical protein [Parabacteroides distasonis]
MKDFQGRFGPVLGLVSFFISIRKIPSFYCITFPPNSLFPVIVFLPSQKTSKNTSLIHNGLVIKYGAGGIRQPYVCLLIFPNFASEERQKQYRTKNNR